MSFSGFLKQSTAVDVLIGPFVDSTDGDTAETALTIAQADVRLSKNGQNMAQKNDATSCVHDEEGMYNCELDATDTNTVGQLTLVVHESGALLVKHSYQVIEEAIYDALFDTSANGFDSSGNVALSTATVNSVADQVWDEAVSGHVAAGSFGAANQIIRSATAQAGASTTITLDASASANDDEYNDYIIVILSGTGALQSRIITDYNGTTKVATVGTWATNPDATSVFAILPFGAVSGASAPTAAQVADAVWDEPYADHTAEGSVGSMLQGAHEGTAQAGTTSSITLDATGSSSTDDFYNYSVVEIIAGTGAGQPSRQISDYNGTTKVATVAPDWTTAPSTDSQYVIKGLGIDAATEASIADAVWDEPRAGHVTADTFGERVIADAVRISGSASAADGLEDAVSGTTPLPANVTQVGGGAQDLPTATALATVDANVDSILADTGTDGVAVLATSIRTALGMAAADLDTQLSTIDTVVDNIETDTQNIQSRLPASLNNGAIPADVQRINDAEVVGDGNATPWDGA